MIVISAALVLVALVLLLVGLVSPDLPFVYASIAVSLLSFAFLLVGVLQRRRGGAAATGGAVTAGIGALVRAGDRVRSGDDPGDTADATDATSALPPGYQPGRDAVPSPAAAAADTEGAGELTGEVLVVQGRPRYHAAGCRYLTGKDSTSVDVAAARAEGYTACGVCRPDDNLAPVAADEPEASDSSGATSDDEASAQAAAVTRSSRTTRAATARPAAKAAGATTRATTPVKKAAAKAAPATAKAASKAASKPATKAASKAAAPAKQAAPVKRGSVVVIPDRGKFHTADCRYVRAAVETLELTRAQATKQGYVACGVCSP